MCCGKAAKKDLLQNKVIDNHALNLYWLSIQNRWREAGAHSGFFRRGRQHRTARDDLGGNHFALLINQNLNIHWSLSPTLLRDDWIGRLRQTDRF